MDDKYKPIRKTRASDLVVQEIWNLIQTGELKPGDRLPPENRLVERFEISKVTLREALQTLEAYGLITKKRGHGGGSIVLDIAPTQGLNLIVDYLRMKDLGVEKLVEARRHVEPFIAELAARNRTEDDIQALKELLDKHEKDFQARGVSMHSYEFEPLLARLSGNLVLSVIQELFMRLEVELELSIPINALESPGSQRSYNQESYVDHRRIAEAVIAGDPEQARAEMMLHRDNWAALLKDLWGESKASIPRSKSAAITSEAD